MPDSHTPETQALLPVTAADVDAALATFDGGLVRQNDERNARGYTTFYHPKDSMRAVLEEFSARQSSSNAGGVDPKRIADCINAAIGHGEHGLFVDVEKATESILASLSTPTAEPTDLFAENAKKSGAETLDGLEWTEDGYSLRTPYDGDADGDGRPIIVGGEIVVTFSDSDEGDKYRERILRALTTPPTPDRIGKDAVREALLDAKNALIGYSLHPSDRKRAIAAIDAALTPSALSGDAGEIPRVPTEAMCAMGDMHMQDCSHDAASVWAAMVSALPSHQGAGE